MSELARKLIEKNKRTRARTLDLRRCGLSEIPAEVGELVWLESLRISKGRVSDVTALASLSALQTLGLDDTQVSDVAPSDEGVKRIV